MLLNHGKNGRNGETMMVDGRDDVSLEHRYAILRDTKNGKERMVNLCPRVVAALSTLPNLGSKGPLFLRYDGRPYIKKKDRGYKLSFWFYSQTKDVVRLKAEGGWESDEWERYVKLANPSIGRLVASSASPTIPRTKRDQTLRKVCGIAPKTRESSRLFRFLLVTPFQPKNQRRPQKSLAFLSASP